MKLIVGLGNPGLKYSSTRHNSGFKVIKLLAKKHNIKINKQEYGSKIGAGAIGSHKVILAMPQKFMNLSGDPVRMLLAAHKIKQEDLLVICDDVNIPLGHLRLRAQGSAGGHNGLKSIIGNLKSELFSRLRVGVGQGIELKGDITGFVLGDFNRTEAKVLPDILSQAIQACESWVEHKQEEK